MLISLFRHLRITKDHRPFRLIMSQAYLSKSSINSCVDIYVQTLPIIHVPSESNDNIPSKSKSKILLCKWTSGNFKDRYTGLIKILPRTQSELISSSDSTTKQQLLLQESEKLVPPSLTRLISGIDLKLVGCLRFEDTPACDEYIYTAKLLFTGGKNSVDVFNETIMFDEHPCYWFDWDKIPFAEMPADDEIWYPEVLWRNKKVRGSFTFGAWSEKEIKDYELQLVDEIK